MKWHKHNINISRLPSNENNGMVITDVNKTFWGRNNLTFRVIIIYMCTEHNHDMLIVSKKCYYCSTIQVPSLPLKKRETEKRKLQKCVGYLTLLAQLLEIIVKRASIYFPNATLHSIQIEEDVNLLLEWIIDSRYIC